MTLAHWTTWYYLWYKVSLENYVLTYWRCETPKIILQLAWGKFHEMFRKKLSTIGLEFIARFYLVLVEMKHIVQQISRHVWVTSLVRGRQHMISNILTISLLSSSCCYSFVFKHCQIFCTFRHGFRFISGHFWPTNSAF